jgi:uncharacterized protein YhaN
VKLRMLHIDRFGMWHHLSLGPFSPGVQVLYGRNEAGKTTLRQFIKFVLFGPGEETQRFLPEIPSKKAFSDREASFAEGKVVSVHNGQTYHIRRTFSPESPLKSTGQLRSPFCERTFSSVSEILPAEFPPDLLLRLYFLELREIQELALLSRKELADLLFRTSISLLGIPLSEVLRAFQKRRETIWGTDLGPGGLRGLAQDWGRLRTELARLVAENEQAQVFSARLDRLREEESQLAEEVESVSNSISTWEEVNRLCPLWQERSRLQAELDSLGPIPPGAPRAARQLERIATKVELLRQKNEQLTARIEQLEGEIAHQFIPRDYRDLLRQVRGLSHRAGALSELENRLSAAQAKSANLRSRWETLVSSLPASSQQIAELIVRLELKKHRRLRQLAELISEKTSQWRKLAAQHAEAKTQLEEAHSRLAELLNGLSPEELSQKIQDLSGQIHRLRQQSLHAQRRRELVELERMIAADYQRLADQPPISAPLRLLLRGAFATSTLAVLASIFLPTSWVGGLGWPLLGFGGVGLSSVLLIRYFAEASHARQLTACRQQLEQIRQCLGGNSEKISPVEVCTPSAPSSGVSEAPTGESTLQPFPDHLVQEELARLERELKQLQAVAPQQAALQRQREQVEALAKQVEESAAELAHLREEWVILLGQFALPDDLPVEDYLSIFARLPRLRQLHRQLARATLRYRKLARRWDRWHQRLTTLENRLGIEPALSPQEFPSFNHRITTLFHAAKDLTEKRQHLLSLQARKKKLQKNAAILTRRMEYLDRQISRILRAFRVERPEDLYELAEKARLAASLQERLHQLTAELEKALRTERGPKVREILERSSPAEIQCQLEELRKQQAQLTVRLTEIREAIASYQRQWECMSGAEIWWETKARLKQTRRHISSLLEEYVTVTAAEKAFLRSLDRYQQEYQPEALQLASSLLAKVTEGRYCRIWAPLDSQILVIEDHVGRQWTIEQLSTGTCEQILICLRLALVSLVASRGVDLPLMLDDVFVNFDKVRMKATARMLVEWAGNSQQVFLFTCHSHIAREFFELGIPVFRLPAPELRNAAHREESLSRIKPIRRKRLENRSADVRALSSGSDNHSQEQIENLRVASDFVPSRVVAGSEDDPKPERIPAGLQLEIGTEPSSVPLCPDEERSPLQVQQSPGFSSGYGVQPHSTKANRRSAKSGAASSLAAGRNTVEEESGTPGRESAGSAIAEASTEMDAKPGTTPAKDAESSGGHSSEHLPHGSSIPRTGAVRLRVFTESEEEPADELGMPPSRDSYPPKSNSVFMDNPGDLASLTGDSSQEELVPELAAILSDGDYDRATLPPGTDQFSSEQAGESSSFSQESSQSLSGASDNVSGELSAECPESRALRVAPAKPSAEGRSPRKYQGENAPRTRKGRTPAQRETPPKTREIVAQKEPTSELPSPTSPKERIVPRVEYYGNHQGSFDAFGRRLGPG